MIEKKKSKVKKEKWWTLQINMQNASRLVIIVVIKSQNTELKRKGIKKERMKRVRERERESECERIARKNMFAYTYILYK